MFYLSEVNLVPAEFHCHLFQLMTDSLPMLLLTNSALGYIKQSEAASIELWVRVKRTLEYFAHTENEH